MLKFGVSVILVIGLATFPVCAQSTAILTGIVLDPSGAVIPDAEVTCTNEATRMILHAFTNQSGLFRIPEIPVGSYDVTVSHSGFATLVRNNVVFLTEHTVDLPLTLRVGESTQSVVVTAPVPLVQASTSDIQMTVNSKQMSELPLNGRNAFQLALLTPGAFETDSSTVVGQQDNTGISVNGLRPTDNNWQLDGGSYTNQNFGSAPTLPNPDTLQEFTSMTSNFSAQNRGAGAVVKLTTRSGTNQLHGSLYNFLRNNAMDTRNFFSLDTEIYKQNQYGATVGGPIRKNKLFFFGSFQGMNKRGSPTPVNNTVPSADQHAGDFSKSGHTIIDPQSNLPFPNNLIPKDRWDPIGARLLATMSLPNLGSNTLVTPPPANKDDTQWMGKIDYLIGEKDHLSGRYFWNRNAFQRDVNSQPGYYGQDYFHNQTLLVTETHTFSPTWVIENTFNYLRTFRSELPVAPVDIRDLAVKVPVAQSGIVYSQVFFTISGYTRMYSSRSVEFNPATAEYQSSLSHAAGRHFIRFGSNVRHNNELASNVGDPFGAWTFSAQRTNAAAIRNSGDAIASLLLSVPQTFAQSASTPTQRFVSTPFDVWIQDDWRISRRLTLNLGLRFDPYIPARDDTGILMGFVPGARSTIMPLAPGGLLLSGDPGIPDAILPKRWNEFGPRVGFAWDVAGSGKTVVRGGYGIFQMGAEVFGLLRAMANAVPSRALSISIASPASTQDPYAGYAGGTPFPFTPLTVHQLATYTLPANFSLRAFDPTLNPGYTQSWNFTVERQLLNYTALSLSYVGNHFLGSMSTINMNGAIYGPGATLANEQARRPYPGFSDVLLGTAFNHGTYNALQVQVNKRAASGLTLLANYTFGKALDLNSSGMLGSTGAGTAPRNPLNANLDKGPADFDAHHSLKIGALYDLPKVRSSKPVVKGLFNNWQLNTIVTIRTGFPVTCRSGGDQSLTGISSDTCDQLLTDTKRPAGADPVKEWFNTAAFANAAIGTFGQMGRNAIRGPGALNTDVSLFKRMPFSDRWLGELRVEVFNVFNHPNFGLFPSVSGNGLVVTVGSPTFGQLLHASDPRLVQLALKLRF